MRFKNWLIEAEEGYPTEGGYSCAGMSLNADFWWNDPQEFLTTRSYKILESVLLRACIMAGMKVTDHKLLSYQGQAHPDSSRC